MSADGMALRTVDLSAGYGGRAVLSDVSIDVHRGQIVSIVGPNGSGKSTLLKSIVGAITVMSGTVLLDGHDVTNKPPEFLARAGVGYVPQVDDVFGPLSVRENLEMGGYLLPRRRIQDRIDRVVGYFPALGPLLGHKAAKLSGGERKMLAMGRVLMLRPALFVLDEPTANLAPATAKRLLDDHIRQLSADGASVLVVEQRARAVLEISDHTYVLAGGRLRMAGSPGTLATSQQFVDSFLGGRSLGRPAG